MATMKQQSLCMFPLLSLFWVKDCSWHRQPSPLTGGYLSHHSEGLPQGVRVQPPQLPTSMYQER